MTKVDEFVAFYKENSGKTGISSEKMKSKWPEWYQWVLDMTKFLDETYAFRERTFAVISGITEAPKCLICSNHTHMNEKSGDKKAFNLACSPECRAKLPNRGKAGAAAMKKKSQDPEWKKTHAEKVAAGVREKYGVDNVMELQEIRDRQFDAYREKTGYDFPMQNPETLKKSYDALETKYGRGIYRPLQITEFKEAAMENAKITWKKNGWYGNQPMNDPKQREIMISSIIRKYGVDNPYKLYNKQSKAELKVLEYIKSIYDGEVVSGAYGILPSGKEIDIYIPELKLGIEYNGLLYHSDFSEAYAKNKYRNADKISEAASIGIHIISIFEDDWKHKNKIVKDILYRTINRKNNVKIQARKTKVIRLEKPTEQYIKFMDDHHMLGHKNSTSYYALVDSEGNIVSSMSFIKTASNVGKYGHYKQSFELNRYCTIGVIGGFAKLLKAFRKDNPEAFIYSLADLTYVSSVNNVYLRNNFVEHSRLKPDYSYYDGRTPIRKHKFNYRKNKFAKMGINIEGKTEKELAKEAGLYRIYDCGKILYVLP